MKSWLTPETPDEKPEVSLGAKDLHDEYSAHVFNLLP